MESVYSTKLIVLAAKFEGRRWSASRGLGWAWGPHPFLSNSSYLSAISVEKNPIGNDEMTSFSVSQKVDTETGQVSKSHRDLPSNLAARTLRSVEHTPSKFGHGPCRVRQGLVAAVKRCVRKARVFRCPGRLWNRTREARAPEPCLQLVWVSIFKTMAKTCFAFYSPIP